MRHIKMYESWLNEAKSTIVPMVLDNSLKFIQDEYDHALMDLSKFGNIANEIRSFINDYRSQYLSSSLWSSINTKQGLESSLQDFKKLYYDATLGYSDTQTPFHMLALKLFNSDTSSKIWNSKEVVDAAKMIKMGNPNLSKSIAAGIILSQLSIAITKGLYYYSASIPYNIGKSVERSSFSDYDTADRWHAIKTVQGVFDEASSPDIDVNYNLGKAHFSEWKVVTKIVPFKSGTSGRVEVNSSNVERYEEVDEFRLNMYNIKRYIDTLNLDTITSKDILDNNLWPVAQSMYSILFVGNYIGWQMQYRIEQFSKFMQKGGPSWYQKIIG